MLDQYLKPNVKRGALYAAVIGIIIGVIGVIPLLNCIALPITCVVGFLLPIVIGWLVAQWGGATEMGKGAMDGAIAAGVGGLISGVIVFILAIIINVVFSALGMAAGSDAGSAATGLALGVVGNFIGKVIVGPILAAVFGAVGGLLYVAIQGSKKA